jgi:phosphoglycerate dehydrogenase-like enzyme
MTLSLGKVMDKPQFLVIASDADDYVELLENSHAATICRTSAEAVAAYSGETILLGDPASIASVLSEFSAVRWVQSTWAGVTPLLELGKHDYVLTNVRDIFGPQMSEYVFGYLLAHELRIAERAEAQREKRWLEEYSGRLERKRIGIMGTGSIGRAIAETARAFGMSVVGLSRSGTAMPYFDDIQPVSHLDGFLADLDYLVSVLPDTAATTGLLDARALSLLPQRCYFINVGRGNVVDDTALVDALHAGRLSGATLDVFDEEPLPQDNPLWDAPNLNVTAHIASISDPELVAPIFNENYRRYAAGEPLNFVVDFDAGY